jgi:hypothetical protein
MTDEVTTEERDNTFRGDNLHEIQASNASYLYDHLRIKEILTRLDRLEGQAGLDPVEPDPIVVGQPAGAREIYLRENEILPLFPGPDNSTPVFIEDEANFRDRIANLENKPVGLPQDEVEEAPSAYDTDPVDTDDEDEDEDEPEQLSLFDDEGNLTPEAKGE